MDKNQLAEFIRTEFGNAETTEGRQFCEASISPASLHEFATFLRNNDKLKFDFLFCLTGVDWKDSLGVVYHLRSTELGHTIVFRAKTADRNNAVLDSVSDIWRTAEYHEREVYDLLGIKFSKHPDLRRFFLEESAGHPLRKDYVDDINIVTK